MFFKKLFIENGALVTGTAFKSCFSEVTVFKRLQSFESRLLRTVRKLWRNVEFYATKDVSKSIPHCCDGLEYFISSVNVLLVIHVFDNKSVFHNTTTFMRMSPPQHITRRK